MFLLGNVSPLSKIWIINPLMSRFHRAALILADVCLTSVCRSRLRMLNLCPLPVLTPRIFSTLLTWWWLSNMLLEVHTRTRTHRHKDRGREGGIETEREEREWRRERQQVLTEAPFYLFSVGVMPLSVQVRAVFSTGAHACVSKMEKRFPVLLAMCVFLNEQCVHLWALLYLFSLFAVFARLCAFCGQVPRCTHSARAGKW